MSAVLFLDQSYRPLRIEHWKRAIADLMTAKVEIVHYSEDRTIRGVNQTYPMPSVVRVLRAFKRDRIRIKFSRLNIYARDRFRCAYCGDRHPTEDLTFDHVLPRSRGGRTTWENIVPACRQCNSYKGDQTPEEAKMPLLWTPKKPRFLPSVMVKVDRTGMPPEWAAYWTGDLIS